MERGTWQRLHLLLFHHQDNSQWGQWTNKKLFESCCCCCCCCCFTKKPFKQQWKWLKLTKLATSHTAARSPLLMCCISYFEPFLKFDILPYHNITKRPFPEKKRERREEKEKKNDSEYSKIVEFQFHVRLTYDIFAECIQLQPLKVARSYFF